MAYFFCKYGGGGGQTCFQMLCVPPQPWFLNAVLRVSELNCSCLTKISSKSGEYKVHLAESSL